VAGSVDLENQPPELGYSGSAQHRYR
jgi:hypothetical protein